MVFDSAVSHISDVWNLLMFSAGKCITAKNIPKNKCNASVVRLGLSDIWSGFFMKLLFDWWYVSKIYWHKTVCLFLGCKKKTDCSAGWTQRGHLPPCGPIYGLKDWVCVFYDLQNVLWPLRVFTHGERERERVRGVKSILILNEVVYKEAETWLTKAYY